jgi:hypothetical protein
MEETSNLSSLEGLTDIGLNGGADMRPTLLRVLTDLYVQKLTHMPDEERHYTELALRLLESVDAPTRAAVAARLAHHLSPPSQVIEKLAADLPEVAAALRPGRSSPPRAAIAAPERDSSPTMAAEVEPDEADLAIVPVNAGSGVAGELNELFFNAAANERRLILLNLDIVASPPAGGSIVAHDPTIGRKLEAAALARRREDLARELAHSLRISREQAHRIVRDELGEPIIVAAKALSIPRDLLYRILLFVNTAVGHSVERVHALAELYDEITVQAAQDLVAVWQELNADEDERGAGLYQPLLAGDKSSVHPASAARRTVAPPPRVERSNAS